MASFDLSSLLSLRIGGPGRRYVLTVGEEFTVLTLLAGSRVKNAWIVPAEPEEGIDEVRAILKGDRKTPVTLLADTFEQIYKEEAVPRVGRFDQAKVVRRHAAQAVPGDMWQGALPQGQDPRGGKLFFLFCGLPRTEHVSGWVRFYEELPNPRDGIHLLPLESLGLMNALFDSEAKAQGGVRWRIMTTMNVTGGLRQIVAKQGRMMLTRLTPAPPEDMDHREAAAMMARDFRQTLTYVKRMGYREGDALDLALIVDPELADALRATQWDAQSVLVTTPQDVGQRLGLGSVGKEDQPYGDVLHAAWFANSRQRALSLARPSEQKTDWQKQAEQLLPLAATAAAAGVLYGSYVTADSLWATWQDIDATQSRLVAAQAAHEAAQAEVLALTYDPETMRGTLALADELQSGDFPLLPLLRSIDAGLKNRAFVTALDVANGAAAGSEGEGGQGGAGPEAAASPEWRADMELVLVGPRSAEEALTLSADVMAGLGDSLPDLRVTLMRPPVAVLPEQTLVGQVRQADAPPGTPTAGILPPAADPQGASGETTGRFTMRVAIVKEAAS